MADSNTKRYVTTPDGRTITYERWLYEQTTRQEQVLAHVNSLIMDEAANAVSVGANFSRQDFGGLLRKVVPALLDQYGKVNATAAVQFYNQMRDEWLNQNLSTYKDKARGSQRYATARTRSVIALNKMSSSEFSAKYAEDYKVLEKSDNVINFAMKVRATQGHEPSVAAMQNALTREVAAYHRDTILFNAGLDENVSRVQRVAQATACSFCRLMALGSTNGKVRVSTYAVKFHDNCHCTIQPLFAGDDPVRPPYYDDFEKQYQDAYRKGDGTADGTLAEMRRAEAAKKPGATRPVIEAKAAPSFKEVDWNDLPEVDTSNSALTRAMNSYQTDNYPIINDFFRKSYGPEVTPQEFIDAAKTINDGLYKTQLKEDVILYRHQNWDGNLDKLQQGQDLTGSLWNSKSPLSTYVPTAGGKRFGISDFKGMAIQWKIHAPKGTYGGRMVNNLSEENEFVLAPNTDLLITKVERDGERYIIDAVVTGQKKVNY